MYLDEQGQLFFSPSDLTRYFESEFVSWMDRYQKFSCDDGPLTNIYRNPKDPLENLLAEKGMKHETLICNQLRNNDFIEIPKDLSRKTQLASTLQAMYDGKAVIYQGALQNHELFGYADLLERRIGSSKFGNYHYAPVDLKISSVPKPTAIIQLCAYADMLLVMQGTLPEDISIITRDEKRHVYKINSFFFFYSYFKLQFLKFQSSFSKNNQPLPSKSDDHKDWSIYAKKVLHDRDDASLTAGIRQSHIRALKKAGVTTLTELSRYKTQVEGIAQSTLTTLVSQALLQVQSKEKKITLYKLNPHPANERIGLAMLPEPHDSDIFFDMEGYPLLGQHGLEYLYGMAERKQESYIEFWAYTPQDEGKTFKAFMEWIYKRWTDNRGMHIYHYSHYEPSTLKRLMGTYGVCEKMMDDLLRHGVFVDLYAVVTQGLQIGTNSYGLKSIESLYYPERKTEVSSGAESAVEFAKWLDSADLSHPEGSEFLNRIKEYNKDDCWSTKALEQFLQNLKAKFNIKYVPLQDKITLEKEDETTVKHQCAALKEKLLSHIPIDKRGLSLGQTSDEFYAAELMAHCLLFHHREDTPEWWDYYRLLDLSQEQLASDSDTLVGVKVEKIIGNELLCQFPIDQDSKLRKQSQVLILENRNPFEQLTISEFDVIHGRLTLSGKPTKTPLSTFTLAPARNYIKKDALQKSLLKQASKFDVKQKYLGLRKAVFELLLGKHPDIINHKPQTPLLSGSVEPLTEIISAVSLMNYSVLCIQGPPGTGKTFTGSRVIAEILKSGRKVAISSNSHKAINHLLLKVNDLCQANGIECRALKVSSSAYQDDEEQEFEGHDIKIENSKKAEKKLAAFNLVGATVFFFSKENQEDKFDYLFVDEATQVALPNLLAMAQCTKNVVLLGDQMQLEQPTKAVHPGDSGHSALVHLTQGSSVVSPDFGFFLGTSYRMHPDLCQVISDSFYEGALTSSPETNLQKIVWDKSYLYLKETGVQFIAVPHQGNKHGSIEEVTQIETIVSGAIKSEWIMNTGEKNEIGLNDILIVAPYNYQVALLKERLGSNARVGSVDIFQGQEAPLVILSLCASSAREAPRGLSFLLNKNRINVALSRAKCVALVVGCPDLWEARASSISTMEILNTICRIRATTKIGNSTIAYSLQRLE